MSYKTPSKDTLEEIQSCVLVINRHVYVIRDKCSYYYYIDSNEDITETIRQIENCNREALLFCKELALVYSQCIQVMNSYGIDVEGGFKAKLLNDMVYGVSPAYAQRIAHQTLAAFMCVPQKHTFAYDTMYNIHKRVTFIAGLLKDIRRLYENGV